MFTKKREYSKKGVGPRPTPFLVAKTALDEN